MKDTFNEYLVENKSNKTYTSEHNVNEGFMDFLKKDWDRTFGSRNEKKGWVVKIDFSTNQVIDEIVEKLRARDEFKTSDALADKEKFGSAVSTELAKYIKVLTGLFLKNHGHLIVKPEGDKILDFIFDNYTEKDPKNYAKEFVSSINHTEGEDNIRFLSDIAQIYSYDYIKSEVNDKEIKNNNFNRDNAEISDIAKDDFVIRLMNSIYTKVKETVDKNNTKAERGEQIKVFSIPFKIDDSVITKTAKEIKESGSGLNAFYSALTKKINNTLKEFLGQLVENDNIKSYLGFIPVKSYGFNLYFKDRDIAEEASEILNQENGAKVAERMRYEKRISKMPTVLEAEANIGGISLHGPSDATSWFRNTKFAIEHVGELVNEYFPGADDQVKIKNVRFEIDKEQRQSLGNNQTDILENLAKKVKNALYDQKDFIVMTSDNNIIEAKFLATATDDNIRTLFNGVFNTTAEDINITAGALTQKEIDNYKEKFKQAMSSTKVFLELFGSLVGYNAEKDAEAKAEAGEERRRAAIKFTFTKVRDMNDGQKSAILNAIRQLQVESFKDSLYSHLMLIAENETVEKPKRKQVPAAAPAKPNDISMADAHAGVSGLDGQDILTLVMKEIKSDMNIIGTRLKCEIKVVYDKDTDNIIIDYPVKAKAEVGSYIEKIKDKLNNFIAKVE